MKYNKSSALLKIMQSIVIKKGFILCKILQILLINFERINDFTCLY